jgi:hypothetical protein
MQEEQNQVNENSTTSDIIVDIKSAAIKIPKFHRRPFTQQYIEKVFYIWYNHGKLGATTLRPFISPELDDWGRIPTLSLLTQWITDYFKPRAEDLDRRVREQLEASIVSEKVEMLKRHADIGVQMQNMAIAFLNENQDTMQAPAAVRLLVEGIRVERESRGIPAALDKMMHMSDEQLINEINGLLTAGSVSLEDVDANSG